MEFTLENTMPEQFHNKQLEVMKFFFEQNPKMMLLYGSVRSGKTYILIVLFLMMVAMNRNKKKVYLIAGRTKATIWRNVIMDMEKILGRTISLDKANCFQLFGNRILVLDGGERGCSQKLRGLTLSGSFINESTVLEDDFLQECQNRLSDDSKNNGWMLADTNPDALQSYTYKNYVKNDGYRLKSGRYAIKCFKFTIWDNPFITEDYVEQLIKTTPDGHMFERMINGEWCNSSGAIWKDFDPDKHVIRDITDHYSSLEDFYEDVEHMVGSYDIGYEHYGVALLGAKTRSGKYYIIEGVMERRKQFDFFADIFLQWQEKYGWKFPIYFDWARPDAGSYLEDKGLDMQKANKQIVEGITSTSAMMKQDLLFITEDALGKKGLDQMLNYEWRQTKDGENHDAPKKMDDDWCDALRYLIHSDIMNNIESNRLTVPQFGNFMM